MRRDICILCGCVFTTEFLDGFGGSDRGKLLFAATQKMALSDLGGGVIIGAWSCVALGGRELSNLQHFDTFCVEYLHGLGMLWQMQ